MSSRTYQWCYDTLGVDQSCTWSTLRTEYRRKLHALHPDLQPPSSNDGPGVQAHFQDTVRAFRLLNNYRRRHGELPPPSLPLSDTARHGSMPVVTTNASDRPAGDTARARRSRGSRLAIASVGTFLLAVAAIATANFLEQTDSHSANAGATQAPPAATLAVGMSPIEVLDLQGVPTLTKGSVWFYGESGVIFERGCVTDWESDPAFPLRVDGLPVRMLRREASVEEATSIRC